MISLPTFALVTLVISLAGAGMIILAIGKGIKDGFREAYEKNDKKSK